jgi:cobalamin biosynthesis Mg chelatase CobN
LRFLASQQVPGKGTKGFTNKSPAFTVSRAPASSTGTGGGSGGEQGSTGAGSRNITNERTVTLQRPEEAQQGVPTQGSDATGADATAPTGGVPASQAAVTAPKSAPAVTIQPSIDPAQAREQEEARKAEAAEGSKQAAAASATARHLANAEESVKALKADRAAHRNGFPWIGTLALVVVVLALLVATWFVARRTRRGTHEA